MNNDFKRIMFIDDQLEICEMMAEKLHQLHPLCRIDFSQTISGAIKKMKKVEYDLIMLDNQIPLGSVEDSRILSAFDPTDIETGTQFILALQVHLRTLLGEKTKVVLYTLSPYSELYRIHHVDDILYIQKDIVKKDVYILSNILSNL